MSFQAHLDSIEEKTGLTPRVIRRGPQISGKHVGSTGSHRDESDTLWLDGKATRPA